MDAKQQQEFDAELAKSRDKITAKKVNLDARSKYKPADETDLKEEHKDALEEAGLLSLSDIKEQEPTEKQKKTMKATDEKYSGLDQLQVAIEEYLRTPLTEGVRSFDALERLHENVQLVSAQDEVRRAGGDLIKKPGKLASLGKLIQSMTDYIAHPTKALITEVYILIHNKYESEQAQKLRQRH